MNTTKNDVNLKDKSDTSISDKDKIIALKEEIATLRSNMMRSAADFQNALKTKDKTSDHIQTQNIVSLVRKLMPVLDSLDMAIHGMKEAAPIYKGAILTRDMLRDALDKSGVTCIQPTVGENFNTELHEAISSVTTNTSTEAGTIQSIVSNGYVYNKHVIRPARVIINKFEESPK